MQSSELPSREHGVMEQEGVLCEEGGHSHRFRKLGLIVSLVAYFGMFVFGVRGPSLLFGLFLAVAIVSTGVVLFSYNASHSQGEVRVRSSFKDSLANPSVTTASVIIAGAGYFLGMVVGILSWYVFFAFFFLVAFLATGIATYSHSLVKEKRRLGLLPDRSSVSSRDPRLSSPPQVFPASSEKIFVKKLGRAVRSCCYQTARLGDQYCICGRAIEPDLLALFKDQ